MDELVFCQMFPFSERSRAYLKKLNISLEDVSDQSIKRAALMVSRAFSGKDYSLDLANIDEEVLEDELVAFPVAKMFVSLMAAPNISEKFSMAVKKNTFNSIVLDKNSKELSTDLASDFGFEFSISQEKGFFIELPLLVFLDNYFIDAESKLSNVAVEGGKVFLTHNEFARFLSEKAYKKVFDSLPIKKEEIPKKFHAFAKSIDSQLVVIERKNFDMKIEGKLDPNLFPPCMKVLYADQLAGKKLSYMARLSLASFLRQLHTPKQEVLSLFSKSPDFKKHIADYHINRIFERELSAPSCRKMANYGLRVAECDKECLSTHPVKYYLRKLKEKNRAQNASNGKTSVKKV